MTLIAIVGAGPAGLAAAESALSAGANVVIVDLNDSPGGQYHRQLPEGYRAARVVRGRFDETYGEFVLPYAEVLACDDPAGMLSDFFDSAYEAGANLAKWDRDALEREPIAP